MKRLLHWICLACILLVCAGCVLARIDGPYKGRVIDAETSRPIEGAVVSATWYKVEATPAGGVSTYYDSYEMLTDKNGEFSIPGKGLLVFTEVRDITLSIFKAGYKQLEPNLWQGLRDWGIDDSIIWQGEKGTFKLRRLSLAERRNRSMAFPDGPNNKHKLFIIERNKENTEIGRSADTLLPVE